MKTLGLLVGLLFTTFVATAQDKEGVTVHVTIENIQNDTGKILAGLHSQETFMKGRGVTDYLEDAKTGTISFSFEDVTPGSYAIMVLHDLNENMQMDFEANGMPKEAYGISKNTITMGPPVFTDCNFEVADTDIELTIKLVQF